MAAVAFVPRRDERGDPASSLGQKQPTGRAQLYPRRPR
jgi:hypothetical protein